VSPILIDTGTIVAILSSSEFYRFHCKKACPV